MSIDHTSAPRVLNRPRTDSSPIVVPSKLKGLKLVQEPLGNERVRSLSLPNRPSRNPFSFIAAKLKWLGERVGWRNSAGSSGVGKAHEKQRSQSLSLPNSNGQTSAQDSTQTGVTNNKGSLPGGLTSDQWQALPPGLKNALENPIPKKTPPQRRMSDPTVGVQKQGKTNSSQPGDNVLSDNQSKGGGNAGMPHPASLDKKVLTSHSGQPKHQSDSANTTVVNAKDDLAQSSSLISPKNADNNAGPILTPQAQKLNKEFASIAEFVNLNWNKKQISSGNQEAVQMWKKLQDPTTFNDLVKRGVVDAGILQIAREEIGNGPRVFGLFLSALGVRERHIESSQAEQGLNQVLKPLNLKTVHTEGGGDCLYHAVANATGQGMKALRNKLHGNLQSIAQKMFLASEKAKDGVGKNLAQDAGKLRQDYNDRTVQRSAQRRVPDPVGERDGWGYDRHLRALAYLEKRPIVVISGAGARIFQPDFKIENQYTTDLGGNGLDRKAWGNNPIVLANGFNHYENVAPASGHRLELQRRNRGTTLQNNVIDNPWLASNNDEKDLGDIDELDESLFLNITNDNDVSVDHGFALKQAKLPKEPKLQLSRGRGGVGTSGLGVGRQSGPDYSRQAHLERESESLAKSRLTENVKKLFGKTSTYRAVRGHEQSGTEILHGMKQGTRLQRLFDARNALDMLEKRCTSPSALSPLNEDEEMELAVSGDDKGADPPPDTPAARGPGLDEILKVAANKHGFPAQQLTNRAQQLQDTLSHYTTAINSLESRIQDLEANPQQDPFSRVEGLREAKKALMKEFHRFSSPLERELDQVKTLLFLQQTLVAEDLLDSRAPMPMRQSELSQLQRGIKLKLTGARQSAGAAPSGAPARRLRRAVRYELPILYGNLKLNANGKLAAQRRQLESIAAGGHNNPRAKLARRTLKILRNLEASGIDTNKTPRQLAADMEARLSDRDRLEDLVDVWHRIDATHGDATSHFQQTELLGRRLEGKEALAKADYDRELDYLRELGGVQGTDGLVPQYREEAAERIAELAANNRLAYGEEAELFKKAQFDQKIDYNDDMFTGGATRFTRGFSEQRRTQAIREVENQADKLEKTGKPAFRLREKIALAKEKRAREYIAELEKDIRQQTEVAKRALNPQNRADAKERLAKRQEQLSMVDGKLKAILAEKQRLFDAKTDALRQLNYAYLQRRFLTPQHVLQFMEYEKTGLLTAVRAAQNEKQAKKMHASSEPGFFQSAWRAIKSVFIDHANDVKEISKVSAKAITIHQEAADLGEAAADRLGGPITHFDLGEKFFGMVKSGRGFYKKMRAALKEPSLVRDWEQPQQETVDTLRETPFRMLAKRKAEANEYVSAWQGLDIVKEGIGTVRYTTDSVMKAGKEAALRGNETAKGMSKAALGVAQKQGSQFAGAGLSAYGAMKGTVEALDAKKENNRRKTALKAVEQQFPPGQNQPVDPSIQDLRAVHKLGVRNAQVVTKSVGVAKDALNATAYGFGAAVAFGTKSAMVTSWAPPLALSAASAAILYGSGKEISAYNARSLKALHRDAMAGRVGPTTKQQLESEAARNGFPTGKDYLDHLLIQQDVRYATRRLLINFKREMRAGDSSGDLVSRLEQRRLATPEKEREQDPLSIYRPPSDSNFARDDAQRIERSPTAHFLEQMGMSRAEVLALADSADDEATNEACRQLIQIQLKLKG